MSSALASPTAYAILCTEGLQEMLPLLRADASVEVGAVFDTLALAMTEGHSDARTLTRTAKRLWRATLGEPPAADPDDETTPGWESLRSKLDRCVARARDSLARSLVGHQARATEDAGPAGVATSGRTLSAAEETDMDARWQASGRRVPGEIFMPSSSFLATMRKYLWPVGHVDTSEGMVVRPSSMEWPAKEQAPIEVVATRKGVHFRPAGKVGVAPTTCGRRCLLGLRWWRPGRPCAPRSSRWIARATMGRPILRPPLVPRALRRRHWSSSWRPRWPRLPARPWRRPRGWPRSWPPFWRPHLW